MFKFESVETKSYEFRVAYEKLLHVVLRRTAKDSAFANQVRQAVGQFNHVYAINLSMPVSTCLLPRHCYKLGRYSTPELCSFEYAFGFAAPSGLYGVHVLTYTMYETVMATFDSLINITAEEDPVRWFAQFSKCSYWESFSTAILGVPEWKVTEPIWKLRPIPYEEVGARTVGMSSEVRGFLYPVLTLSSLLVQVRKLMTPALITPQLYRADGIEDYLNLLQSMLSSITEVRDNIVSLIKYLVEE